MNFLCESCSLKEEMEKYKIMLNNLILKENHILIDEEIIKLSQSLDTLVYRCIFCNKNLNNNTFKIELKNIFGTHSTFYYYGYQHLFNSMYFYINQGINNNELIYISMEENLYSKLLAFLKVNNVSVQHIKFRPVKELIESNTMGGLIELKEKINNICLEDEVKKYKGIRWIGQPTYAIKTTSQEAFLNWEINLSLALKNTNASLICIYDTYDYMTKGEFINEKVIKQSLTTHTFALQNSVLEKIK
jgi:hypothetical protein